MIRHYPKITPIIDSFSYWELDAQIKSWTGVSQGASWSVWGSSSLVTPIMPCFVFCFIFFPFIIVLLSTVSPSETGMSSLQDRFKGNAKYKMLGQNKCPRLLRTLLPLRYQRFLMIWWKKTAPRSTIVIVMGTSVGFCILHITKQKYPILFLLS